MVRRLTISAIIISFVQSSCSPAGSDEPFDSQLSISYVLCGRRSSQVDSAQRRIMGVYPVRVIANVVNLRICQRETILAGKGRNMQPTIVVKFVAWFLVDASTLPVVGLGGVLRRGRGCAMMSLRPVRAPALGG
ncbi:hypothetical protein C8Q79DRAFT_692190 [Trametes meyenii]|nr:hypothetical protein C8Q79DRAFT_692190 [Trametes meyenii]